MLQYEAFLHRLLHRLSGEVLSSFTEQIRFESKFPCTWSGCLMCLFFQFVMYFQGTGWMPAEISMRNSNWRHLHFLKTYNYHCFLMIADPDLTDDFQWENKYPKELPYVWREMATKIVSGNIIRLTFVFLLAICGHYTIILYRTLIVLIYSHHILKGII